MRLEQHDVELGQEVKSQGDIGGEREADAGGDHLGRKKYEQKQNKVF